jgi:hypothetical protein
MLAVVFLLSRSVSNVVFVGDRLEVLKPGMLPGTYALENLKHDADKRKNIHPTATLGDSGHPKFRRNLAHISLNGFWRAS